MIEELKSNLKSKFVGDTLVLQSAAMVQLISGLVLSAIIARTLGPYLFGMYALIYTLYRTLYSFVIVGVGPGTVAKYSNAWMRKDYTECENVLAFYFKTYFLAHFIAFIIGATLSAWVGETFYKHDQVGVIARWLFIDGVVLGFYSLTGIIFQATRMMRNLAIYEAADSIIRTVAICSIVLSGGGLQAMIFMHIIISAMMSAVGLLLYKYYFLKGNKAFPEFNNIFQRIKTIRISDYISVGFKIRLGETIYQWIDLLPQNLLGIFARPEDVGYFRLAINIVKAPDFIFRALTRNLLPMLYEINANGGVRSIYSKYWIYSSILGIGSVIFFAFYALMLPLIILFIYGDEYSEVTELSKILVIAMFLSGFGMFAKQVLIVVDRQGIYITSMVVSFLIWAVAGYIFIESMQSIGAAIYYIGMQLSVVLIIFIACGLYLKKNITELR